MMKICITGGTGYVGKYLSLYLLSKGYDITVTVRSQKSKTLAKDLNLQYIIGNLNNLRDLIPKLKKFEIIIHCAFDYSIDFKKSIELDKAFIENILDNKTSNLKQFIYTSSAYALHSNSQQTSNESVDIRLLPLKDKWIFKHEDMVNDICSNNLKTAIIRAGMVYGGFGGSIDHFFKEASQYGTLDMPGDGNNYWSFIHVKDLARMYTQIIVDNLSGIFHGVDNKPLKVIDVFNAINKVCLNKRTVNKLDGEKAEKKYGLYYKTYLSDIRVVSNRISEINFTPDKSDFISSIQIAFNEWKNKQIYI